MFTVAIEKTESYDPGLVRASLRRLLEPLGGISAFVKPGERVLLKPNMLSGNSPDKAVTTHPELLAGVIELVQAAGGIALVGDSPGFGSTRSVARKTGMLEVIEAAGAELVEFSEVREVVGTGVFKRFEIAAPYLEADRIINLPKLKTHEMMTLTCGVKNLFGAVVGAAKPAWHLQAGEDRNLFARVLLEIYQLRPPDLTIVDAIVAMEGAGPGSGDPCQVGLLVAGVNPVAVDIIAGEIAGIPKRLLYVERESERLGLPGSDRATVVTVGLPLESAKVRPFRLPQTADLQFGMPLFLKRLLRNQLTTRPIVMPEKCLLCEICLKACPALAMTIKRGRIEVDQSRCIHCFCCRELCPEAALRLQKGFLLRLFGGREK